MKIIQRRKNKKEEENFGSMKAIQVYTVEGMTCNHCKANVENGVGEINSEIDVFADPDHNELRISGFFPSEDAIKSKVESLGYIFKGKKNA